MDRIEKIAKNVASSNQMDAIGEIWKRLSGFRFGARQTDGSYGIDDDDELMKNYSLASPRMTLEEEIGTCWDIASCAKYLLDKEGIQNFAVFCTDGYDFVEFPHNHCFNVAVVDGEFVLVDASERKPVKKYGSLNDLLSEYGKDFRKFYRMDTFPPDGSGFWNFVEYASSGEELK